MIFQENEKNKAKKTAKELLKSSGLVLIVRRDGVEHTRHDLTNRHSFNRAIVLTDLQKTREIEDEETLDKFLEEELNKGDSYDVFPRFIHINMNFQGNDGSKIKFRPVNLTNYGIVMFQFIYLPFKRTVEVHIENQDREMFSLLKSISNVSIDALDPKAFKQYCNLYIRDLSKEDEIELIKNLEQILESNNWKKDELLI